MGKDMKMSAAMPRPLRCRRAVPAPVDRLVSVLTEGPPRLVSILRRGGYSRQALEFLDQICEVEGSRIRAEFTRNRLLDRPKPPDRIRRFRFTHGPHIFKQLVQKSLSFRVRQGVIHLVSNELLK